VGRRLGILGLVAGIAVVAAALLYNSYAALQRNDQTIGSSGRLPRSQALSDGWAEENVRQVQTKLREGGFYSGEIDGAYSSDLAAALTRYQIRNGLPITGQLDGETSKALDAKPAVAASANTREQSSETWRRLRFGDQQTRNTAQVTPMPANETIASGTQEPPRSAPTATEDKPAPAPAVAENKPASTPPTAAAGLSAADISTERVRDYVGAFVLAGLDPNVGSEADFFADRVQYYDEGMKDREKIRKDLQRYDSRWPGRKFWLAGDIKVEPQKDNRVRVTFPLRYELRNGANHKSGKINKTLVLAPAGNDLEIVAVNERKANL
jgi:peptidoglycan hydrolase-like protein with peptidoglycan-binding domain